MKKIYILFVFLILFSACSNKNEFDENKISAEKEIIFNNISNNLDYQNAGRAVYDKNLKYSSFLDVSKENDYEKYLVKYSYDLFNLENDFLDMPYVIRAIEFIKNGSSLSAAYKHIAVYYMNRENLGIFDFNIYNLPYGIIDDEEDTDITDKYVKGVEAARQINLSLLKARNMIKYAIDNQLKTENSKVKAQAYLFIAISYLAQDRLYNISDIKKYAALWKELGGLEVEFLNKTENKQLTSLLTYIAYNENTGVVELLQDGIKKGFLQTVLSKGGVYNYLNDGFYMPVGIASRGEKYAVNPFYEKYKSYRETTSFMKKLVSGKESSENDKVADYNIQNNFDTLYDNQVYLLALNGAVYTVEMVEKKIVIVEFRNPAYFDVSYASYLYNSEAEQKGLPKILSEYEYNFIQKDYVITGESGKLNIIWNGSVRNQMPDVNKLFTFKGVIDCLNNNDDFENLEKICSSRENMIKAKYIHKNKCDNKTDCFITSSDVE